MTAFDTAYAALVDAIRAPVESLLLGVLEPITVAMGSEMAKRVALEQAVAAIHARLDDDDARHVAIETSLAELEACMLAHHPTCAEPATPPTPAVEQAIYFDGANGSFLELPDDVGDFDGPRTIAFWAMFLQVGFATDVGTHVLAIKRVAQGEGWLYGTNDNGVHGDQGALLGVTDDTGLSGGAAGGNFTPFVWHHVAISYDPATTTARSYLDGVPTGSRVEAWTPIGTDQKLRMAVDADNGKFLEMLAQDPVVFPRVLADAEVAAMGAAYVPVTSYPSGITHRVRALEGGAIDEPVSGAVVTVAGGVSVVDRSPGEGVLYSGRRAFQPDSRAGIVLADVVDMATPQTAITLEIWFKRANPGSGTGVLASKLASTANSSRGVEWGIIATATGQTQRVVVRGGSFSQKVTYRMGAEFDEEWHHLAVVLDDGATMYLDGVDQGIVGAPANITSNPTNTEPWRIGTEGSGISSIGGSLARFYLHARALTAAEVLEAAQKGKPDERATPPPHAWELGAYGDIMTAVGPQVRVHDLVGGEHGTAWLDTENIGALVVDDTLPAGVPA